MGKHGRLGACSNYFHGRVLCMQLPAWRMHVLPDRCLPHNLTTSFDPMQLQARLARRRRRLQGWRQLRAHHPPAGTLAIASGSPLVGYFGLARPACMVARPPGVLLPCGAHLYRHALVLC